MQRILAYIFFVEAMGVTFLYTIYFNCRKEVEKKKGTVDKKKICVDISTKLYKFDKKIKKGEAHYRTPFFVFSKFVNPDVE